MSTKVLEVDSGLRAKLLKAREELDWLLDTSAEELFRTALRELSLDPALPCPFPPGMNAFDVGQLSSSQLETLLSPMFPSGVSAAADLADQIQLFRAFSEPSRVTRQIGDIIRAVVERFPRSAEDILRGHNPGDVLDPFILSANYELLSSRSLATTIETTVSHKALMKIEDLVGKLHESVLGEMRGNVRIAEPKGRRGSRAKEELDPLTNPFPGADLAQVPSRADADQRLRLFQVKSKTGTTKGGDGARLGRQLHRLEQYYNAATFFVAIVGNTLKGHRSRTAVQRESPGTVVLVGARALRELTRSEQGGELLLKTYERAFRSVAKATPYDLSQTSIAIVRRFEALADVAGEEFLIAWLHDAIDGLPADQDSRLQ